MSSSVTGPATGCLAWVHNPGPRSLSAEFGLLKQGLVFFHILCPTKHSPSTHCTTLAHQSAPFPGRFLPKAHPDRLSALLYTWKRGEVFPYKGQRLLGHTGSLTIMGKSGATTMDIPQRWAAQAEVWISFCQTAKKWAGKVLPGQVPCSEDAKLAWWARGLWCDPKILSWQWLGNVSARVSGVWLWGRG